MTSFKRYPVLFLLMAFFLLSAPPQARADDVLPDEIVVAEADAQQMTPDQMAETRAGYTDPTGALYSFAVDVKTDIDGKTAFSRSIVLNTTPQGQITASSRAQLVTANLPQGASAAIVNNGQGIVVTSQNGTTTALNQTAAGALSSIITNTVSDRNISQTLNIGVALKNTNDIQLGLARDVGLIQSINFKRLGYR